MSKETATAGIVALLVFFFLGCRDFDDPGNLVPATADQDPSLPQITLNGCTFHLQTFGDPARPAVIFLPGGLADHRPLLRFTERFDGKSLADDYFLVLWDMRGKGLSERFDAGDISFDIYAEDVAAVVDRFSPDREVVLVGHSFGGTFAAQYMNAHPDRIAGAVLLESGAFSSDDTIVESDLKLYEEWVNDLATSHQLISGATHEQADFNMAQLKCQEIQKEMHTQETTPFWRIGTVAQDVLGAEYMTTKWDFSKHLGEVAPEILIVAGAETERLGVAYQEKKRRYFASSRFEIVEGAGHGDLIWSKAEAVAALIRDYLDGLELEGAVR